MSSHFRKNLYDITYLRKPDILFHEVIWWFFMEEKKDAEKFTSVLIPTVLAKKIEKRIQGTEFSSISSYVTYVLKEIVSDTDPEESETLSKEDDERIKARLRSLGYLD